jgi:hypothetical protein
MAKAPDPPDWSKGAVVRRLQADTPSGRPASAQFFLDVPEEEVGAAARRLFDDAVANSGSMPVAPKLGKVRTLARSFSVEGDPQFLAELAKAAEVRDVLPSQIDDIYPKPVKPGGDGD